MKLLFLNPYDRIGKAISGFGKLASGDAKTCHVGVISGEFIYEALVIGGLRKRPYKEAYASKPYELWSISKVEMPLFNECEAKRWMEGQVGKWYNAYGFSKIPMQAADAIASFFVGKRIYPVTTFLSTPYFPICSSFTDYVLYKFGNYQLRELFKLWRQYSPDDTHDIVVNSGIFKRVR